jgi:hypothetical protein
MTNVWDNIKRNSQTSLFGGTGILAGVADLLAYAVNRQLSPNWHVDLGFILFGIVGLLAKDGDKTGTAALPNVGK